MANLNEAGYKHLGRQPYAARKFLLKYQDRILFGCGVGRVPAAGLPWKIYGLPPPPASPGARPS